MKPLRKSHQAMVDLVERNPGIRPVEIAQHLNLHPDTVTKELGKLRALKVLFSNGTHMCRRYYASAKLAGVGENDSVPVRRAPELPPEIPPPSWRVASRIGQVPSIFDWRP